MKRRYWTLALFFLTPQMENVYASTQNLVRTDGSRIEYYLMQRAPISSSNQLLVLIQGSDCNSVARNYAINQFLVNAMPKADVLTVEKYGIDASIPYNESPDREDCPFAYIQNDSPMQRVQDLQDVIAMLVRKYAYDTVVAIGGSEGALVANMLSPRSKYISATVAFNGGGQWFVDDIAHSISLGSASQEEKEKSIQGIRELVQHIRSVSPASNATLRISGHGYRWWRESVEVDQLAVLNSSITPTLIIQSESDQSVSPAAVQSMIATLYRKGKRNIDFKTYPGLDHRMHTQNGDNRMPDVVEDITAWLRNVGITP